MTHPALGSLRFFSNLSVRQRLFASFGVVLALMVMTGAVAIVQLNSVGSKADHLYRVNLSATELSASVRRNGLLMRESIRAGAKDFVVKPFQADRVLDAIGKAVG